MHVMSRLRTALVRRPWIYWSAVGLVTAFAAASAMSALSSVERQRRSWGETTAVIVATRAIAPGDALAGNIATRSTPTAMVPDAALDAAPADAVALGPIALGEIVVGHDVTRAGVAARLEPGWLAIAIDSDTTALFAIGDPVAVLGNGVVLADDAVVVDSWQDTVVVGLPAGDAAVVADLAAQGLATVALSASPRRP